MDQASYGQKPTTGATMNGRSPVAVKVDNLIRSKLRVSNPYDPSEIADGLHRFYKSAAELTRLENAGLPFYQVQFVQPPRAETTGPSNFELQQARSDVGTDLSQLLQNQLLKDIVPELRGWQSAIDNIIADGAEAAPLSLDPRMRDRGYQARRLLGDYARVARFVGALTPSLNDNFRALARSLDEVSSVLMVLMGDAIASIGYSGGRFLLQAQASDLQDRRDAVLYGLRNLVGSTQLAFGPGSGEDDWPRGLQAYRQFIDGLDRTGNSDLRALFQEANLARLMDDLIARVNVMNADGLRALGSTAVLQVQPMRRLIQLGQSFARPPSPQLAAFLDALLLFVEAFKYSDSGSRLIQIARPSIVSYGLYGVSGPDQNTLRLGELVIARGNLAVQLDCFLPCQCSADQIRCQIILDKLLYDIDRAIDALSLGFEEDASGIDSPGISSPETRAFAYGLVIETLLLPDTVDGFLKQDPTVQKSFHLGNFEGQPPSNQKDCLYIQYRDPTKGTQFTNPLLGQALIRAVRALLPPTSLQPSPVWQNVTVDNAGTVNPTLPIDLTQLQNGTNMIKGSAPPDPNNTILRELCMQKDAEDQWKNLLRTLAPSCFRTTQFVNDTSILVDAARVAHARRANWQDTFPCPLQLDVEIPGDPATSWDTIAQK
jgi:hypothetical protein